MAVVRLRKELLRNYCELVMDKKTVWIINQYAATPERGVAGRHYYLGRELVKQGYNVYVISAGYTHLLRTPVEIKDEFLIEDHHGVKYVWVNVKQYPDAHSKGRIRNWLAFAWKIRKLKVVISDRPDTVLVSSPSLISYLGARSLAKKYSAKLVFEVRDIWPLSLVEIGKISPKHPFIRFLQWIEDKAYKESDAVLSNLKYSVQHMMSRGMSPHKFTWIPNGLLLEDVQQSQPLEQSVKSQLPIGKFLVGYTGTLGVANALDVLINAAEQLKNYTDIAFVIVGNGKEKPALQQMVENKGLDNVYFINSIPKAQITSMLEVLQVCYIGLTSDPLFRFGVSPNKLFDYLYAAKPIIYAIDSGEYTPVEDFQAGIQVQAGNSADVAKAVLHLYHASAQEREKMGDNGRVAVLREHEYGMLAQKMAKVLFG